jgi:hypothetical protein
MADRHARPPAEDAKLILSKLLLEIAGKTPPSRHLVAAAR